MKLGTFRETARTKAEAEAEVAARLHQAHEDLEAAPMVAEVADELSHAKSSASIGCFNLWLVSAGVDPQVTSIGTRRRRVYTRRRPGRRVYTRRRCTDLAKSSVIV